MEDVGATEEQWDNTPETIKEKRGEFLYVLIVLTWVSNFSAGTSAIFMLLMGKEGLEKQLVLMDKAKTAESKMPFIENMMNDALAVLDITMMNFTQINLMNLLVGLTGAFAAFLMYKLKKVGFLLYLVYCAMEIAVVYYFFGNLSSIVLSMIITGFFSILFIIMYSVNVKRMTE